MNVAVEESDLKVAVTNGDLPALLRLLHSGTDPNETFPSYGYTALHRVAFSEHPNAEAMCRALLENSSDVHRVDQFGYVPLHTCATKGAEPIAKLLLTAGADVDRQNRTGCTALHLAVLGGHLGLVSLLLDAKSNVNHWDHRGNAPLHKAAESGAEAIAILLIDAGAEVNVRNRMEETPLHLAASKGAFGFSPIQNVATDGYEKIVARLLGAGAWVDYCNKAGATALHCAVNCGCPKLTQILLSAGADVYIAAGADEVGCTALHRAVEMPSTALTNLLLSAGANVLARNLDGETCLEHAMRFQAGLGSVVPVLQGHLNATLAAYAERTFAMVLCLSTTAILPLDDNNKDEMVLSHRCRGRIPADLFAIISGFVAPFWPPICV